MEEKTFLKVLRQYFELKADNEILIGDKKGIVIPMEWIFTEKIDREIIQRAMVETLKENNPGYIENYLRRNEKQGKYFEDKDDDRKESMKKLVSTKVKDISLNIDDKGLKLIVNGLDNWTKAIISENPYKGGKILQISEDEFCEKILGVLKSNSIQNIVDALDISEEERQHLQTIFAARQDSPLDEFSLNGIKDSMVQAAENLTEYYEYLSEEQKQSYIHAITINQRQGTKAPKAHITQGNTPSRKSPIYPFTQRENLLRQMKPTHVINVNGYDEEGNIVPNVYTAFIYENPKGKQGRLLVAEPLEGSHSTRLVYMTNEEFESFEIPEDADRYGEVSKYYLEMSNDEFLKEENAVRINHGDIEEYSAKIQFVLEGKISEKIEKQKWYYNSILNKLYGQKELTTSDIGSLAQRALCEEVREANAVLDEIDQRKKNIDKGTKGEYDG